MEVKMQQKKGIEQQRLECEARQVLAWPFAKRKPYLALVGKRRGEAAQMELQKEVIRQHRMAKEVA